MAAAAAGTDARGVYRFEDSWIGRVQAVKPGACYKTAATVGTCAIVAKHRPSIITCWHVWEALGRGEEAWVWLTKANIAFRATLTDRMVDEDLALLDPVDPLSNDVIRCLPEPPPLARGDMSLHSDVVMMGYADALDQHIEKDEDGGPAMYSGRVVSVGSSEVVADYHCLPNCSGAPVVDVRTGYIAGVHVGSVNAHMDVVATSWPKAQPDVNEQLKTKAELAVFSPSIHVRQLLSGPRRTALSRSAAARAKRPRHTAHKQRGWLGWARQVLARVPMFGWLDEQLGL